MDIGELVSGTYEIGGDIWYEVDEGKLLSNKEYYVRGIDLVKNYRYKVQSCERVYIVRRLYKTGRSTYKLFYRRGRYRLLRSDRYRGVRYKSRREGLKMRLYRARWKREKFRYKMEVRVILSYESVKLLLSHVAPGLSTGNEYRRWRQIYGIGWCPANPEIYYGDEWVGWIDFLPNVRSSTYWMYESEFECLPFRDVLIRVREIVRREGIGSKNGWMEYVRGNGEELYRGGIPKNPIKYYGDEWLKLGENDKERWEVFLGLRANELVEELTKYLVICREGEGFVVKLVGEIDCEVIRVWYWDNRLRGELEGILDLFESEGGIYGGKDLDGMLFELDLLMVGRRVDVK